MENKKKSRHNWIFEKLDSAYTLTGKHYLYSSSLLEMNIPLTEFDGQGSYREIIFFFLLRGRALPV